jgi:acyl-lipid omega-6 desaturase (Delta-12 desaturase)
MARHEEDTPPGHDKAFDWKRAVAKYRQPSRARACWQLANTLLPYAATWLLIQLALGVSLWLVVPLVVLAAGLMIRVFIIFHDCGHGSFFRSRRANDFWGYVTGMLTFTPYRHWNAAHAGHHGSSSDLDRRGVGDVWMLTVEEYRAASRWRRWVYRAVRSPFGMFVVAPLPLFVIAKRFAGRTTPARRRAVWITNAGIVAVAIAGSSAWGVLPYVGVQLAILQIADATGIWLFYVQHQFEGVYWARHGQWDYGSAAMRGSSYLRLPRVLQWFTGSIGFHHVHHLCPLIPNYNLQRCHDSHPWFRRAPVLTWRGAIRALRLRLWDEASHRMVGFESVTEPPPLAKHRSSATPRSRRRVGALR